MVNSFGDEFAVTARIRERRRDQKRDSYFISFAVVSVIFVVLALGFSRSFESAIAILLVLCLIASIYLLPFAVAFQRSHKHTQAIFALNLLLGWSFIGWVVALVWALTATDDSEQG